MMMANGWTGGQYSVFRTLFGACLLARFALDPALFQAPWWRAALAASAALASVLVIIGWGDRAAALWIGFAVASAAGRAPPGEDPSWPLVVWLLIAHAFLPRAPYGSLAARGRLDPRGGWRMPPGIVAAAWILLGLCHAWDGWMKLRSGSWLDGSALREILELPPELGRALAWSVLGIDLLFAPLALFRRLRPWVWLAALAVRLFSMLLADSSGGAFGGVFGIVWVHLFAFDPAWIPPRQAADGELVFYDGACGLCHRAVRFLIAEDPSAALRFAPLQGETAARSIAESTRRMLPDSVVVHGSDGAFLVRFAATRRLLQRLGGLWRLLGAALAIVPTAIGDRLYDAVARRRHRWFARPPAACPVLPQELRRRFSE
jgi:predicted DCC family thiol-disulfide oxidoreductase YuxK